MKSLRAARVLALLVVLLVSVSAQAATIDWRQDGGLLGAPEYDWWYGCSPTAAGMLMGYYDALGYDNLVPGGTAELSSWDAGGSPLANAIIASPGHINDFYSAGYLASGDDLPVSHTFDCLADFMGTSQDAVGSPNGSTTWYYWSDGSPLYYTQFTDDPGGQYGIYEYVDYRNYSVDSLYTQLTDNLGLAYGFSYADYTAQIDAGRPMLLHVEGHSMLAYGYDPTSPGTIFVRDTWSPGVHTMEWGGSYSDLSMWGVTVLELAPVIPEPATIVMFGCFGAGLLVSRVRKHRKS